MVEVYGWLSWASSGTSRGMRNLLFGAVLLWRDGGNREVPPGGGVTQEDHERVLRAVIRAGWPDGEPTWQAFLEGGGAVLRVTDVEAINWLPSALTPPSPAGSTASGIRRRRSPSPYTSGGAGDGRAWRRWS